MDGAHEARTGGRAEEARTGPSRRRRADGRTGRSGAEVLWSYGLGGQVYWQSAGRADGWMSGWAWV